MDDLFESKRILPNNVLHKCECRLVSPAIAKVEISPGIVKVMVVRDILVQIVIGDIFLIASVCREMEEPIAFPQSKGTISRVF
jgi:hypothetical protein